MDSNLLLHTGNLARAVIDIDFGVDIQVLGIGYMLYGTIVVAPTIPLGTMPDLRCLGSRT